MIENMESIEKIDSKEWEKLGYDVENLAEDTKPGLKYWQDVWMRFRKNPLSLVGLVGLAIIVTLAVFGPMFSENTNRNQYFGLENTEPRLDIYKIDDESYVYVHKEIKLISVTAYGELISLIEPDSEDFVAKKSIYNINGNEVALDYTLSATNKDNIFGQKYQLFVNGEEKQYPGDSRVSNKKFLLGTDTSGRDVWVRILYGARVSLMVGLIAAIVNMVIGVLYGGIAGYMGGALDNVMMRIVDIIQSVPLMLIVILLMVMLDKSGMSTIILALGMVYWVSMARQVRGQVISLKEAEFVLAAKALGASDKRIILKHLIPNALGPIIVSITMSIPQAIFTESFLSFVGLGVTAPQASWGTMANNAIAGIRSYPYQIVAPSIAIALTMFAFNFVGDGLRDALDPKLRK